jgi:sRNA-binding protein
VRLDRVYRGQGFQSLTPEFGSYGAGSAAMKSDTSASRFNRASFEAMVEHNRVTLQGPIADQLAMRRAETARLVAASRALVQRSRLIKQQSEEALAKTAAIRKTFMASPGAKQFATGEDHAQSAAD